MYIKPELNTMQVSCKFGNYLFGLQVDLQVNMIELLSEPKHKLYLKSRKEKKFQ